MNKNEIWPRGNEKAVGARKDMEILSKMRSVEEEMSTQIRSGQEVMSTQLKNGNLPRGIVNAKHQESFGRENGSP